MKNNIKKAFTLLLASTLIFTSIFSSGVQAGMVSTAQVHAQYDKAMILETLAREDVQKKMLAMGVDSKEVQKRVENLTATEVEQLNAQLQDLPAGADGLGLLVFIFVVFVITDMLGATDIFPFVNKVN